MSNINSFYCPSCRQASALTDRTQYTKELDGGRLRVVYAVAECNNCDFHFLVARESLSGKIIKIWPKSLPGKVSDLIPEPIKGDFEEALVCEAAGSYRGAATLARRTLQVICLEKGAPKEKQQKKNPEKTMRVDLSEQIDWLYKNNIITDEIKNWAHEVRYVGNDAAHPTATDVSSDDARDILELLQSMCDVLYIAPARAAARKSKRTALVEVDSNEN